MTFWMFADRHRSAWCLLAVCGFLGVELGTSCMAWGIHLFFSEPLFGWQWQHIDTTVLRNSRGVVEVPHPRFAKLWSCTKINLYECRYSCQRYELLWAWGPPSAVRVRKLQRGQIQNSLDLVDPPGTLCSSVLEEGFGECLDYSTQWESGVFRFRVVLFSHCCLFPGWDLLLLIAVNTGPGGALRGGSLKAGHLEFEIDASSAYMYSENLEMEKIF